MNRVPNFAGDLRVPATDRPGLRERVGGVLVRLVALVVLFAGVTKFVDVGLPPETAIHYEPWKLAAIRTVEVALAGWALWRPTRLPALLLVGFLVVVTVYLLLIPPGELKRVGCSCFGSRFRFQDVRTHVRLNGVLILMTVVGVWGVRGHASSQTTRRAIGRQEGPGRTPATTGTS